MLKKVPYWIFFVGHRKTTHIASCLFSDSCFSAEKISLLALTVASFDNHLVLHERCNCRPFVFIVVWCIARQADRNGETVKHFHNCIRMLSQFRTPYCTNLRQCSNRAKRGVAHDNAQIPYLQFSHPTSDNMAAVCCNSHVQENMLLLKSFYFNTSQNHTWFSEFKVSLQNSRVPFWHPKTS